MGNLSLSIVGKDEWLADECRRVLHYDGQTGGFTRAVTTSKFKAGDPVGYTRNDGRLYLRVSNHLLAAHRVAWLLEHGRWPAEQIDHINGDPSDNRICNLREATRSQNCRNAKRRSDNTSGYKGVYLNRQSGRWSARIKVNGQYIHLGCHLSADDAYAAYCIASKKYHGEFGRT